MERNELIGEIASSCMAISENTQYDFIFSYSSFYDYVDVRTFIDGKTKYQREVFFLLRECSDINYLYSSCAFLSWFKRLNATPKSKKHKQCKVKNADTLRDIVSTCVSISSNSAIDFLLTYHPSLKCIFMSIYANGCTLGVDCDVSISVYDNHSELKEALIKLKRLENKKVGMTSENLKRIFLK